ncbi:MAG: DnaJ domain-containing protein [Magnetococcus sp. YQC-5]
MEIWSDLLYDILSAHPEGLQEYALVKILQRQGIAPFAQSNLSDELSLFRTHFFLFHQLYRLQNQLRQTRRGDVNIHCLCILLLPWQEGEWLETYDPLRSYYLDQTRLETTTREEIGVMMTWFWHRFSQHEGRAAAYAALDLSEGASLDQIKRRYRELAMIHHPDHGGEACRFRQIAEAADLLLNFNNDDQTE